MLSFFSKPRLLTGLAMAYAGLLLVSNLIANKIWDLGFLDLTLPAAVFVFPFVFIVGDILAEIYGFKVARNVILFGFVINLFAVLAYTVAIALPAPAYMEQASAAYETVLSTSLRALSGSLAAYLVGGLLNAKILDGLHKKSGERLFSLRAFLSTLAGEFADGIIFISIVFAGVLPFKQLVVMMFLQPFVKTLIECLVLPLTSKAIKHIKLRELSSAASPYTNSAECGSD